MYTTEGWTTVYLPMAASARPLTVIDWVGKVEIGYHTGQEHPQRKQYRLRQVEPTHVRGGFAVYQLHPGEHTVTEHSGGTGRPFVTTDAELAVEVCNRWAREFPPSR
jgi:hypothetical protein